VQKEGSAAVPRNRYVEIRQDKPTKKEQESWSEYKTCKFTTEAIVTEGSEKGEIRRVCANPECPIHHARKPKPDADAAIKAEQEKRRREEAIVQVTGLRVLSAILDDRRLAIILRQHNLGKPNRATDAPAKRLSAFLRKADESTLGRRLVELAVLQAAEFYKVNVGAITTKVKQEFATKDKAKAAKTATPKPTAKGSKKSIAA
jgi:ParB family chromosome partitioning protein